jgi:hypothetical protein
MSRLEFSCRTQADPEANGWPLLRGDLAKVVSWRQQGKALIELFKSISVLGKWPRNRLHGLVECSLADEVNWKPESLAEKRFANLLTTEDFPSRS